MRVVLELNDTLIAGDCMEATFSKSYRCADLFDISNITNLVVQIDDDHRDMIDKARKGNTRFQLIKSDTELVVEIESYEQLTAEGDGLLPELILHLDVVL